MVCAFDVVEHVEDDAAAMKEMERVCKPEGIICVTVPAFKMLWGDHDIVNGHYRRYTKNSLLSLGKGFNYFKNAEVRYFNSLLFLPILASRKTAGLFSTDQRKIQSDFTYYKNPGVINGFLKRVFNTEAGLFRFIHFPFGVSLVAVWKAEKNK